MRDRTLEETIYLMFTTRSFSTGAPTQLAGTPVVSAYEDNSVTQITAGITLGVDHDGVTGLNLLTVAATAANGYEAGKEYNLVITTGTVGGVSVVGEVVGEFSLGASAAAVDLANGTDGLGAIKADTAAILVDTGTTLDGRIPAALTAGGNMKSDALAWNGLATVALPLVPTVAGRTLDVSAGGEAGLDWANIGGPTTAQGLSGTTIKTATDVETDTADIQARIPAALTADGNMKADTLRIGGTLQTAGDIFGARAEPAQGAPAASLSAFAKLDYLYKGWRNKGDQTSTLWRLYADDAATVDQKRTVSDDGTIFIKGEVASGP